MKGIFLTIAAVFAINSFAYTQQVISAWHFDTLHAGLATQLLHPADSGLQDGSSKLYLNGTAGSSIWTAAVSNPEVTGFGGTTLNDNRAVAFADSALALANSTANYKGIVFQFSMTNFENPTISFATRGSSTGFDYHIYYYSTDGVNYTLIDSVLANKTSTWAIETHDFSAINALDNAPNAYIKIVFRGATSSSGNNRMDNIEIKATSTIPGDMTPPTVLNAWASSLSNIKVAFSEPVDVTAENTANYTGLGAITSALREIGLDTVDLTLTTPLSLGIPDTLYINNVQDTSSNHNPMAGQQMFIVVFGAIDVTPPTAISATPIYLNTVKIKFSEAMDIASAENTANYTGLAGIGSAALNSTEDTVTLNLSIPLISGVSDTLYIQNVQDTAGNNMATQQMFVLLLDTSTTAANIVITEIMYNSPESGTDSLEFIELFNNGSSAIDLMNYTIKYSTQTKTFSQSIPMAAGDYVVISINKAKTDAFYGINSIQGPTGGISNGGTFVKLISPNGLLVDSLTFSASSPWPTEANGNGYSLVLCDPNSDNTLVANWSLPTVFYGIVAGKSVYASPGFGCSGYLDTIKPVVVNAWALDFSSIKVKFNEAVDLTGENTANYTGLGAISNAIRSSSLDTVTLTLAVPLISGVADTLYISNVADTSGNIMNGTQMFVVMLDTSSTLPNLVITEIMYNSPESGIDSLEFIEIYNNGSTNANLLNYTIMYGSQSLTFNQVINIAAGDYGVIAMNVAASNAFYGINAIQGPSTGITNGGTFIKIVSSSGIVIDSLTYDDVAPWPTGAAGNGYSLTLCDPNSDNTDAANWSVSNNYVGLVGGISVYADPDTSCVGTGISAHQSEMLVQVFPNPSDGLYNISFGNLGECNIEVRSITGSLVYSQLVNEDSFLIDLSSAPSGLYFLSVKSEQYQQTIRLIKL